MADALADAFISDPLYRWMLRGGLRLKQRLRMVFTVELEQYGLPNGGTVVAAGVRDAIAARDKRAESDGAATPT